jgi:hypothetical protein
MRQKPLGSSMGVRRPLAAPTDASRGRRLARWLLQGAAVSLGSASWAACGDGGIDAPTLPPPDLSDGANADVPPPLDATPPDAAPADTAPPPDVGPDVVPDVGPDVAPDVGPDVDPDPGGRCGPGRACDTPLAEDGICPGTCRDVDGSTRCRGDVVGGLCETRGFSGEPLPDGPIDFGDFTVVPVEAPTSAVVGETHPFRFAIRNDTERTLDIPFYWKDPGYWAFSDISWERADGFRLGPGATLSLSATLRALRPTTFDAGQPHIASFSLAGHTWMPPTRIGPAEPDAIACGGQQFPATWCSDTSCSGYGNYFTARCCDDVFYPAADCCVDADCGEGMCADGRCVQRTPQLGSANSLPLGHQHIVFVLVDSHPEFADDPCADRSELLAEGLQLDVVEDWFHTLSMRHLGRETMDIRWTVLAGIQTSDFFSGDASHWYAFAPQLDAWLEDRGCPILGEYDKVMVSASTLDLNGFGGIYYSKGEIGLFTPWNPYLIAHELAHAFGATDLYLTLAGRYQYAADLMGNYLSSPPDPGGGVAWAEMGYGDADKDGVVDIAAFEPFPESLVVREAEAVVTERNSLEVSLALRGAGADSEGRLVIDALTYEVQGHPLAGQMWPAWTGGDRLQVVFDGTQVDLAAALAAGVFRMRVAGSLAITGADWERRTLVIDEVVDFPVRRAP